MERLFFAAPGAFKGHLVNRARHIALCRSFQRKWLWEILKKAGRVEVLIIVDHRRCGVRTWICKLIGVETCWNSLLWRRAWNICYNFRCSEPGCRLVVRSVELRSTFRAPARSWAVGKRSPKTGWLPDGPGWKVDHVESFQQTWEDISNVSKCIHIEGWRKSWAAHYTERTMHPSRAEINMTVATRYDKE